MHYSFVAAESAASRVFLELIDQLFRIRKYVDYKWFLSI